ncbi:hypothetical protein V8C86DRAFT_3138519, partial [Haematococcus lacustris]
MDQLHGRALAGYEQACLASDEEDDLPSFLNGLRSKYNNLFPSSTTSSMAGGQPPLYTHTSDLSPVLDTASPHVMLPAATSTGLPADMVTDLDADEDAAFHARLASMQAELSHLRSSIAHVTQAALSPLPPSALHPAAPSLGQGSSPGAIVAPELALHQSWLSANELLASRQGEEEQSWVAEDATPQWSPDLQEHGRWGSPGQGPQQQQGQPQQEAEQLQQQPQDPLNSLGPGQEQRPRQGTGPLPAQQWERQQGTSQAGQALPLSQLLSLHPSALGPLQGQGSQLKHELGQAAQPLQPVLPRTGLAVGLDPQPLGPGHVQAWISLGQVAQPSLPIEEHHLQLPLSRPPAGTAAPPQLLASVDTPQAPMPVLTQHEHVQPGCLPPHRQSPFPQHAPAPAAPLTPDDSVPSLNTSPVPAGPAAVVQDDHPADTASSDSPGGHGFNSYTHRQPAYFGRDFAQHPPAAVLRNPALWGSLCSGSASLHSSLTAPGSDAAYPDPWQPADEQDSVVISEGLGGGSQAGSEGQASPHAHMLTPGSHMRDGCDRQLGEESGEECDDRVSFEMAEQPASSESQADQGGRWRGHEVGDAGQQGHLQPGGEGCVAEYGRVEQQHLQAWQHQGQGQDGEGEESPLPSTSPCSYAAPTAAAGPVPCCSPAAAALPSPAAGGSSLADYSPGWSEVAAGGRGGGLASRLVAATLSSLFDSPTPHTSPCLLSWDKAHAGGAAGVAEEEEEGQEEGKVLHAVREGGGGAGEGGGGGKEGKDVGSRFGFKPFMAGGLQPLRMVSVDMAGLVVHPPPPPRPSTAPDSHIQHSSVLAQRQQEQQQQEGQQRQRWVQEPQPQPLQLRDQGQWEQQRQCRQQGRYGEVEPHPRQLALSRCSAGGRDQWEVPGRTGTGEQGGEAELAGGSVWVQGE